MDYISRLRYRQETFRQRVSSLTTEIHNLQSLLKARNNEILAAGGQASTQVMEDWKANSATLRNGIVRMEAEKAEIEGDLTNLEREIAEIEAEN